MASGRGDRPSTRHFIFLTIVCVFQALGSEGIVILLLSVFVMIMFLTYGAKVSDERGCFLILSPRSEVALLNGPFINTLVDWVSCQRARQIIPTNPVLSLAQIRKDRAGKLVPGAIEDPDNEICFLRTLNFRC